MKRRLRVRVVPTHEQERLFDLHVRACIVAWNFALEQQDINYTSGNKLVLSPSQLYSLFYANHKEEFCEVSTQTIYEVFRSNWHAYKLFFKGSRRRPKQHSSNTTKSFYVRHSGLYFKDGYCNIEKVGKVKISTNYGDKVLGNKRGDRKFGDPVIKWDGKYWMLTFVIDVEQEDCELSEDVIGIDVGIKNFVTCSDGTTFANINMSLNMKKLQKQIDKANHDISRMLKTNGGEITKNVKKERDKLQRLYRRQVGTRDNYIHQVARAIVNKHPKKIVIESLDILHLVKDKIMAKMMYDQKISKFFELLKYKADELGIEVVEANRYYPSSKTCSVCGAVKKSLPLNVRTYKCEHCGSVIDRDLNAAINLRNLAR